VIGEIVVRHLERAPRGVARGDSCDLPITQEDLGDALGMSSVHVTRTLMVLRAGGLVEFQAGVLRGATWSGSARWPSSTPATCTCAKRPWRAEQHVAPANVG
jgi:hypothetical protein